MSEHPSLLQSIRQNALGLGLFTLFCIGAVALSNQFTRPQIERNATQALLANLQEVLPATEYDNDILNNTRVIEPNNLLANTQNKTAYVALKNQQPAAIILPVTATEGYGGAIQLIVAIYANGKIAGVRVVPPHAETPGLGDKIELKKSLWILSFNGTSLIEPEDKKWGVKKDGGTFDAFTGATITPRAVVKAVHAALLYFEQNKQSLFAAKTNKDASIQEVAQ